MTSKKSKYIDSDSDEEQVEQSVDISDDDEPSKKKKKTAQEVTGKQSLSTPKCFICEKWPSTIGAYVDHLSIAHKVTLYKKRLMALCVCGESVTCHESSVKHFKKCKSIGFTIEPRLIKQYEVGSLSNPKCLECEARSSTILGYATHLIEYHKTTLCKKLLMARCACGAEVGSADSALEHAKECMNPGFTIESRTTGMVRLKQRAKRTTKTSPFAQYLSEMRLPTGRLKIQYSHLRRNDFIAKVKEEWKKEVDKTRWFHLAHQKNEFLKPAELETPEEEVPIDKEEIDNLYHSTKTAFAFFVAEINENLRAENPYYRQIDVIDEAKEQWKCLTDKSRWIAQAREHNTKSKRIIDKLRDEEWKEGGSKYPRTRRTRRDAFEFYLDDNTERIRAESIPRLSYVQVKQKALVEWKALTDRSKWVEIASNFNESVKKQLKALIEKWKNAQPEETNSENDTPRLSEPFDTRYEVVNREETHNESAKDFIGLSFFDTSNNDGQMDEDYSKEFLDSTNMSITPADVDLGDCFNL